MTTANNPVVVLVAPQMGENIGATARSMLNFGLSELRIVNPRDGWPNPKAVDMAKGAKKVITDARVFSSLKDALYDVEHVYASTARPRDMVKRTLSPRQCACELREHYTGGRQSAILLGPERSGLSNDDIVLADAIITIPVHDVYPSLNLAQAAAVISYEWFVSSADQQNPKNDDIIARGNASVATRKEVADMFEHIENALDQTDFFRVAEKRPKMVRNIRNLFLRAHLTDQDVRTLRGMISSLTKR